MHAVAGRKLVRFLFHNCEVVYIAPWRAAGPGARRPSAFTLGPSPTQKVLRITTKKSRIAAGRELISSDQMTEGVIITNEELAILCYLQLNLPPVSRSTGHDIARENPDCGERD